MAQKAFSASRRMTASTARDGGAGATQGSFEALGRHPGVGVELFEALIGGCLLDAVVIVLGMGARDLIVARQAAPPRATGHRNGALRECAR